MEHHIVDYGEYMPHGMCLLWQPWLVILWAGSDLLIFLSYIAIPVALLSVLRKRTEVPQPGLVALFASFILLCGITHFFMIVTLWVPIYPIVSWIKLATGLVSTATAIMLFKLVPDIIALPSPVMLERANRDLQSEIDSHLQTLATLDQQVRDRTAELEEVTTALAVQAREAVHRSSNLLGIVQTLALQSAKGAQNAEDFLTPFLGRLRALAVATRSIANSDHVSAHLQAVIEAGLYVLSKTYGERFRFSGPDMLVNTLAAQQISLAIHELVSNSHKYGLGASERAYVDLRWSIKDEVFELLWQERNGIPHSSADESGQGFGTKLLLTIIPATLEGAAERTIQSGEFVYRLRVPFRAMINVKSARNDTSLADQIIKDSYDI